MAVVFLAKSGIWPLGFWMPSAYSAAAPPVAALLTLVTKMGVYVLYRLWPFVAADNNSDWIALGGQCLFWAGVITMLYASFGLLASRDSRRRSEEHTSELQSRPHLVCRLLLEKKK